MERHNCGSSNKNRRGDGWDRCIVCEGRIHLEGCKTKRDKNKDCCEARHKMLHEQGQTEGLCDLSFAMYDPAKPSWSTT